MGGSRSRRGFTVLELILVVAILATVAGGVLASLEGAQDRAAGDVTTHELGQVRDAVLAFRRDLGALPVQADAEDLSQLLAAAPPAGVAAWDPALRRGWRGPYLRAVRVQGSPPTKVLDAFGRPFVLDLAAPGGPRVLSRGQSLEATDDDRWVDLR